MTQKTKDLWATEGELHKTIYVPEMFMIHGSSNLWMTTPSRMKQNVLEHFANCNIAGTVNKKALITATGAASINQPHAVVRQNGVITQSLQFILFRLSKTGIIFQICLRDLHKIAYSFCKWLSGPSVIDVASVTQAASPFLCSLYQRQAVLSITHTLPFRDHPKATHLIKISNYK